MDKIHSHEDEQHYFSNDFCLPIAIVRLCVRVDLHISKNGCTVWRASYEFGLLHLPPTMLYVFGRQSNCACCDTAPLVLQQ
jgi:hypothetical protein